MEVKLKKSLLTIAFCILFSGIAQAATVVVDLDIGSWTQEQKNLIQGAIVKLLHENGINDRPSSIDKQNGDLVFTDPVGDVASVLNQTTVLNEVNAIIAAGTRTDDEIKAINLEEGYSQIEAVVTALVQVLKQKNPTLDITNIKADVIAKMKSNAGL